MQLLMPLTLLSKKDVSFSWIEVQDFAFKKIKAAVVESVMLTYPDISKPFIIYTYARNYTIGGLVMQDDKTISCFLKKLTPTQQKYAIPDK